MKLRRQPKRNPKSQQQTGRNMPVNNYYRPLRPASTYDLENNSKEANRERKITFAKLLNYTLLFGILGLVVFATTLSSTPSIQLKKKDTQYYDSFTYQYEAERILGGSIFNRSKILFQSSDFENKMREKFPEISQIASITPLGGRDLSVLISVSDPFAIISNSTDKGVLNENGVLVSKEFKSDDSGLVKIRFISPQENFDLGARILTDGEVSLIKRLDSELGTMSLSDQSVLEIDEVMFDVTNGLLEVKIKNKPYFLKLSTYSDQNLQIGAVKATLKQLDRDNSLPTKYLDVRIPNRVFVI